MLCKVFSVTNKKGGVGKTTSALNLAAALNVSGKKVLMIDNDHQGNLTAAVGLAPVEQKYTLANLLLTAIDSPEDIDLQFQRALLHIKDGLDLIPANKRLTDAAVRLQVMQLSQYNSLGSPDRYCEAMMNELLSGLKNEYDYIIIDCGLQQELLTVNALAASDYCVIPVQAHFLASEGIPDVLDMVRSIQNRFNPKLQIAGILLTMYQSRPSSARVYGKALGRFTAGTSMYSSVPLNTPSK